jgi:hypothetical protein
MVKVRNSPAISNLHLMVGVESGLELQMCYQLIRKEIRKKQVKRTVYCLRLESHCSYIGG